MIIIGVIHPATTGEWRNHDRRNPRTIAEEIERLEEAGIPVAAAFIEGDQESSLCEQIRMRAEPIENLVNHAFEIDKLGGSGMAVHEAIRLHIGNRAQPAVIEFVEEIDDILDVLLALRRIAHD